VKRSFAEKLAAIAKVLDVTAVCLLNNGQA